MKVEIVTREMEVVAIDTDFKPVGARCYFDRSGEPKWKQHCKEHHLNPRIDAYGKFYEQYLRLCAEGLI